MNRPIFLKKRLSGFLLSLFLLLLVSDKSFAVAKFFNLGAGNWSNPALWNPAGVPLNGDVVTIAVNCSVDIGTDVVGSLTVNAGVTLTVLNLPGATLNISGPINVGGTLDNQGNIDLPTLVPFAFNLFANATYIHNPRVAEEVIFENSTENFATSSNLYIYKWFDEAVPLCASNRITSPTLGNVTIDIGAVTFDQDGLLAPHRIWGSLTIYNTKMIFDDGTGASTSLTLQNVYLRGTAIAVFQTGVNRSLALITNSFTDSSTLGTDTSLIMYNSFGNLNWTINGNLILAHNFTLIQGTLSENASATVTVNGNATFSNNTSAIAPGNVATINFIKQCNAPLTLNVSGTTTISQLPKFRMIDGNNGALNFTTGSLIITGGNNNIFVGGGDPSIPPATNVANVIVSTDFSITAPSLTYIMNSDQCVSKTKVSVGRDFLLNSATADLRIANSLGAMTFKTTRDFTITGGNFTGQLLSINTAIDTLSIGQHFLFNSATAANYLKVNQGSGNTVISSTGNFHVQNSGSALGQGVYGIYGDKSQTGNLTMTVNGQYSQDAGRFNGIYNGSGNMTFTSTSAAQPFLMNGGDFRGIYNPDTTNAGNTIFSLHSMDFNGGIWMMHYGINTVSATSTITFTSTCSINFSSAADQFMFIGLPFVAPANNTLLLSATIGGNMSIGGVNGTFVSSKSGGDETINILGNFDISGGTNSFNIVPFSGFAFGHSVTLNLSGGLSISGGTTFLSAEYGTATATITGNMNITGGTFSIKGAGGFLSHNFNVNGNFVQSAGTFYLHNNSVSSTNVAINVTFNSDFTHSGGTIYFDNNTVGVSHVINIKGANYNLLGTGVITSASSGTGTLFGQINFNRVGTINYNRSGNHDVNQARQWVLSGTTLLVNSGNLQVASSNVGGLTDLFSVQSGGILDLKANQIYSNASFANSIVEVRFGRLRIQNANGLYDNTSSAAINNVGNMNFNLSGGSYVEYYGITNQTLTGIGLGVALLPQHKYGNLDINLPAGAQYVHVSNGIDSVFVRSSLNLKAGELSLDYDHITSNGGGKTVTVEMPLNTGITNLPGGYIRSETEDGSAKIKWKMASTTGIHKVPFGASSAMIDTIPFSYAPSAATLTGDVSVSTYHTIPSNLPYPPTVSQLNQAFTGINNSNQTVDRFWNIIVSGATPPVPNITFYCTAAEAAGVVNPRAQKWMFPALAWSYPVPGASQLNPTVNSAQVLSSTMQTGWWTLAAQLNPLPVSFLDFSANCEGKQVKIQWSTASETNNDHFTIEKSTDGKKFEFFTTVKGAGNSSSVNKYETIDRSPSNGINYYRISQTDFNGKNVVFNTISSMNCLSESDELKLVVALDEKYGTTLFVTAPANEEFVIDVFNASGNHVLTQNNSAKEGFNNFHLNTKNMSAGIYIVKLTGNAHNLSQRFLIRGNQ